MSVNIVVEEASDVRLLERILPAASSPDVRLRQGGSDRGSALSLGSTMGDVRQEPVIVLLDARSVDEENIEVQRENKEPLLSVFNELVFAVPELEAVFFHDPSILERLLGIQISREELIEARFVPKQVLGRLLERSGCFADTCALVAAMDDAAARRLATHPLIQQLEAMVVDLRENHFPERFRYLRTG